MSEQLVVFGSGGHAKVLVEAVLARTPARSIILLDDAAEGCTRSIFGIAVAGTRAKLESLKSTSVALGIGDNAARSSIMSWLRDRGHVLETVLHPAAIVGASVSIAPGAFVGAGAIVIAEAHVGAGAIINTGASVDHDCVIGDAAHIAPGAHLCGNVRIGERTLVGVGSSIRPGIHVCADVLLGAGSVVVRDVTVAGTFAGNPCRRVGSVEPRT